MQRAPAALCLPSTPFRFTVRLVRRFRGWFVLMTLLEAGQAGGFLPEFKQVEMPLPDVAGLGA